MAVLYASADTRSVGRAHPTPQVIAECLGCENLFQHHAPDTTILLEPVAAGRALFYRIFFIGF